MADGRRIDDDPWLTEREAARELRVSTNIIRQAREDGRLGFARIRSRVFYPVSCLRQFQREGHASKAGVVYFARAGEHGPIKIGFSEAHPEIRMAVLQPGCPWRIVLLGTIKGQMTTEWRIHQIFRDIRMEGEWFEATPELLEFIEKTIARGRLEE